MGAALRCVSGCRGGSHSSDEPVSLGLVEPLLAGEVHDPVRAAVLHLDVVQVPAGAHTAVVVPHFHLCEIA